MEEQRPPSDERECRWRLWMVAAQAGDGVAYEKLLFELLPYIRRKLASRIDDPTGREDVVQNVLFSLHRARHTYRSEHPIGPWVRAILRNAAIDWMRAHGRRSRHEQSWDVEEVLEPWGAMPRVGQDTLSPELEGALASLPAKPREAVELLHVEGLSVAEAAERAGVRPGALKVRAHRGYRALRARLTRRNT